MKREFSFAAALLLSALVLFPGSVRAIGEERRTALSPAEERILAEVLAEKCPEALYAARVGMAAAVLGRMESPAHPDGLREVLAELEGEGSFGTVPSSPPEAPGLSTGNGLRRLLRGLNGLIRGGRDGGARCFELSLHAVRAAEDGADPMNGALSFRAVRLSRVRDFLFNDAGEDADRRRIAEELRDYPVIAGNVGFR